MSVITSSETRGGTTSLVTSTPRSMSARNLWLALTVSFIALGGTFYSSTLTLDAGTQGRHLVDLLCTVCAAVAPFSAPV